MGLRDKNKEIKGMFSERIKELKLANILEIEPIENTYKRRPAYYKSKSGKYIFTAFMWQLNKLSNEELCIEVNNRIEGARRYFGL